MSLKVAALAIGLGAFGSLPASAAVVPAPASISKSSVVISTSALGTLGAGGQSLAVSPVEQVRRYGGRYYRGHSYRRGYRGHWIGPAIVLGTAAIIIGGSIAESRARYRDRWEMCAERYVSFSWEDGTFQPYEGPRRLCPYLVH
ncbi:MAG: BA14K family protein [Hyphomicrobiaceae bacterium]